MSARALAKKCTSKVLLSTISAALSGPILVRSCSDLLPREETIREKRGLMIISRTAAGIDPTIFRVKCLVKLKDINYNLLILNWVKKET